MVFCKIYCIQAQNLVIGTAPIPKRQVPAQAAYNRTVPATTSLEGERSKPCLGGVCRPAQYPQTGPKAARPPAWALAAYVRLVQMKY
jgi:hypothetical protein